MEINKINLENITTVCLAKLKNYGQMPEYCSNFTAELHKGTSYGIIGSCGEGGWAISYNLIGRDKPAKGKIKINGNVVDKVFLEKKLVCRGRYE